MPIEMVHARLADGSVIGAALARATAREAPALILVHECWGLLGETRALAEQLAERGFTALAVDLFDGRSSLDPAVAADLMNDIDPSRTAGILEAWADWLRAQGAGKIGILGFGFGGTWSLQGSLVAAVDATVVFYGRFEQSADELKMLRGPVLAHFGADDLLVPRNAAGRLTVALELAGRSGEVHSYAAGHAFARVGGPHYDAAAAALAWQRTDAFLRKHLMPSSVAVPPPSRQARFNEVPIISIAALGGGDAGEAATIEAIRKASEHVGFFYIKDHGVDLDQVNEILAQCRAFFALPRSELEELRITRSACFAGYLGVGERGGNQKRPRDLLEAFNVCTELGADDPFVRSGVPLHGANQWPGSLPSFRAAVLAYYAAMDRLGARMLQAFALALGLRREALDAQYRKPLSQLRLLHYPAQEVAVDEMLGARPHRDVGVFTILLQDEVGGLEVGNAAGDWIMAPPIEGTFVVNLGEMMKLLTNDQFASALHRVVNRSGRQRFSVPFFFNPDYDAELATLPSFIDDARPGRFQPIHVGDHMLNFYRNLWPSAPHASASTSSETRRVPAGEGRVA